MSYIGKNIKKIRGIKSLSQQSFAEIFDLKRATLGAYEEERSEPKIDTIINIANYFSIPIDDLLKKELTVNQLLKFKGELTEDTEEIHYESFPKIPCITEKNEREYLKHYDKTNFIESLPHLRLPVNPDKIFRGYTVSTLEMTNHDQGFFPKDVVVGERVPISVIKKLNNGTAVLILTDHELIFRRIFITGKELVLRADHRSIEDKKLSIGEIKEIWRIRYVFYRRLPGLSEDITEIITKIEQTLNELKGK